MYKECRHIMPDGSKCESPALKDMPYCYYHDRLHRSGSRQKSSAKNGIELQPLEDRSSIQLAISRVICALADGRLDASRAGQLFYGFQVAAQFASIIPKSAAGDSVDSLTRTRDGQELGPEKIKCFKSDDCSTCPYYDECDGEVVGEQDEDDEEDSDESSDDSGGEVDEDSDDDEQDGGEDDSGDGLDNETTGELIAGQKYLESVSNALDAGDMRLAARLLAESSP
jgi:hypothetical protein